MRRPSFFIDGITAPGDGKLRGMGAYLFVILFCEHALMISGLAMKGPWGNTKGKVSAAQQKP